MTRRDSGSRSDQSRDRQGASFPSVPVFKWLLIIGTALVIVAAVYLLRSGTNEGIGLQVLGQTNLNGRPFRMVQVSNGTERVHSFVLWSEFTLNGTNWTRETLEHNPFVLGSHETLRGPVAMPTNGRPRVTLLCAPIHNTDVNYWRDRAWLLFGKNPSRAYKMYLEVN